MNASQRNSQMMGQSVTLTLETYVAVWSGSATMGQLVDQHNGNLDNILTWQIKQDQVTLIPGLMENKRILRAYITTMLLKFSGAIAAWAFPLNKHEMISQVDYSKSTLEDISVTDFIARAKTTWNIASDNASPLEGYGITAEMIEVLDVEISKLISVMAKIKSIKSDLRMAGIELKLAISKMISDLKNQLDKNVKQYLNTPFCTAYFISRKTYSRTAGSTTLKGTVMGEDGRHLHNAEISIINSGLDRTVFTNKRGNYRMHNLDLDTCTIKVISEGYLPAEYDVTLKRSHTTDFDIRLLLTPVEVESPVPVS